MGENDFLKRMQLMSDSELMLDEDRLAKVVGGANVYAADAIAEAESSLSPDAGMRMKTALFRKKSGAKRV
ncbi:MAG: hypothetical protein K6G90_13745 [Clostridia bacterium]|nr:hypothetical protein [Clostridia bacterium]